MTPGTGDVQGGALIDHVTELEADLVELMRVTIGTPSPPGHERDVCLVLADWLDDNGIPASIQEVEDTRANVVGRIRGNAGGPSLTLNAHMDTTFKGDRSDLDMLGDTSRITPPSLTVADGYFTGQGVHNDKGPFVAACIAALGIKRSGLELAGDLVLGGVAGEIGTAQVNNRFGPDTRGNGIGAYHLIHQGVWTDYVVVCESSNWSIVWALPGAAYFQIVTRGEPVYAPDSVRDETSPKEGKNAVVKAAHLIAELEEWAAKYERENEFETPCGTMKPRAVIGAVDGGRPNKPNYRPALANVYLSVFIPPNLTPLDVKKEVEAVARASGLSDEVNMYLGSRGYVGEGIEPIRSALTAAHERIFAAPPNPPSTRTVSRWNDANVFWEVGIPAVKYGAPRASPPSYPERMKIVDMMNAARIYALTAVDLCGVRG